MYHRRALNQTRGSCSSRRAVASHGRWGQVVVQDSSVGEQDEWASSDGGIGSSVWLECGRRGRRGHVRIGLGMTTARYWFDGTARNMKMDRHEAGWEHGGWKRVGRAALPSGRDE
jgi:hypothetical protein